MESGERLTERGRPRIAKTTREAILMPSFPPIVCPICVDDSLTEMKVMTAVAAMQANTMKLLVAQTNLEPINLHIGSIRKELIPRTTCPKSKHNNKIKRIIYNAQMPTTDSLVITVCTESYNYNHNNFFCHQDVNENDKYICLIYEFLLNSTANQKHLL